MSRKEYPKYKPSGVPWLEDVPEGWEVKRLKTSVNYWVSNVDKVPSEVEQPIFLCNYTDVYYNDFITLDLGMMETTARSEEIKKFHLEKGDVVITKDSESWEDIAVPALIVETESNLLCGYHLAMIRPKKNKIVGDFLFRQFQSSAINHQFQIASTGVTRYGLPKSAIGDAIIPLPPLHEQQAIAAFLDRETGRIDALIEKKKRLIVLLKEKRSAMISRAVTKGLDPSVKMKPSGVPWLGDVPEGWEVKRLKTSVNYWVSNVDKVPSEDEQPIFLCNYTDVYYNDFITLDLGMMETTARSEEIKKFHLKKGDVVITKDSESWEDIAVPALIVETESNLLCGYHLAMIRPKKNKIVGDFLFRQFQSSAINHQFQIASTGVTRYGLPKSAIGDAIIPLPPLPEQQAIAAFLDRETAKIDALVNKVETAIERLKEYRISLISSAVTGKIDVRDEV